MKMKYSFTHILILCLAAVILLAQSARAEDAPSQAEIKPVESAPAEEEMPAREEIMADPFEPWNRLMFNFNDRLYFWVVKPVSRGYEKLVPEKGRVSVRNFFRNLASPVRIANNLLQLKIKESLTELTRTFVNTTVGVGGLFDPASKDPYLAMKDTDLGLTFGRYGLGHGPYIVWPILGPSSLRDTAGTVGDIFLYPQNYLQDKAVVAGVYAYEEVNDTSLRIGEYEDLKEAAIDPYIAVKDAYYQYRKSRLKGEEATTPWP